MQKLSLKSGGGWNFGRGRNLGRVRYKIVDIAMGCHGYEKQLYCPTASTEQISYLMSDIINIYIGYRYQTIDMISAQNTCCVILTHVYIIM